MAERLNLLILLLRSIHSNLVVGCSSSCTKTSTNFNNILLSSWLQVRRIHTCGDSNTLLYHSAMAKNQYTQLREKFKSVMTTTEIRLLSKKSAPAQPSRDLGNLKTQCAATQTIMKKAMQKAPGVRTDAVVEEVMSQRRTK